MAIKARCSRIRVSDAIAAVAVVLALSTPRFAQAGTQEGGAKPGGAPLADTTDFSLPGVYPSTIYPAAGRWTFLVTGIPEGAITSVSLRIDGSTYPPVDHEATGRTSSLWDFDFPGASVSGTPEIQVMTERDTLVRNLTVVDTHTPSHGQVSRGEISVRLKPHVFTWAASQAPRASRAEDRLIADVPCADKRLSALMSFYGVAHVIKLIPFIGDADSLMAGPGRRVVFPPSIRSSYLLRFLPTHSVFSFMELLKLTDSVLDSSWLPLVDGFERMPAGQPRTSNPERPGEISPRKTE